MSAREAIASSTLFQLPRKSRERGDPTSPMNKGGAFEGAITLGCPNDKAVDDAIQARWWRTHARQGHANEA